jgi:hypothetical protein
MTSYDGKLRHLPHLGVSTVRKIDEKIMVFCLKIKTCDNVL